MGNNPMGGATVAIAIAIEEACNNICIFYNYTENPLIFSVIVKVQHIK